MIKNQLYTFCIDILDLNLNFTSIDKEAVNSIILTDRWQNIIPNVGNFQERNTLMTYIISHFTLFL